MAKILSLKSLNYAKNLITNTAAYEDSNGDLQDSYNKFADTYAQILYKRGQYDSAFYYQDAIYKQAGQLDAGSIDRYALYSEKVKGMDYAKQLIEKQLLSGVSTSSILKQLQSIYKKLGISYAEFNAIKEKSGLIVLKKIAIEIKTKFGTTKAINFTLNNILGQSISLSSLKGKVVVLDFWATWCTPCIAAFPTIQETVNKYKNDKGVTFLLVDILEHTTAKKMQDNAAQLMKVGNYSFNFNVLLDVKDKLVTNYKIESIPTQFIIDNKGNMVFMGNATDNISSLIEAAKKL
jgi:thiol-disulfide isomerase/thioredoxin